MGMGWWPPRMDSIDPSEVHLDPESTTIDKIAKHVPKFS
jgi:hypothetical protein